MSIRAVVFDLDGTLVDSTPDIAACLNATLADDDLGPLPVETVHELIGHGIEELVRGGYDAAGHALDDDALDARIAAYRERYTADPASRTQAFADAPDALARLAAAGCAIGVCTNKPTELSWAVLEATGMREPVGVVLGADAVERRKPDPAHLLDTLTALGVPPADAVYVGDSGVDAQTAGAAQVRLAMVQWGTGAGTTEPVWMRLERFAQLAKAVETER